ncbi:MAG: pantetheine-phosphate adenylyltransferase [Candidatus Hodarchaeota archaeon]
MKSFKHIGIGGTFDRLHAGHKLFLDIAAFYGQNIHVGLISRNYLEIKPKNYNNIIQKYDKRRNEVKNYLAYRKSKCFFSKIDKPGMDRQLAEESELDALVISQETFSGAIAINNQRVENDQRKLTIIVIPDVTREDRTLESSTRIRKEKNREIFDDVKDF